MGIDPSQYIEMQANYLRLLANCYSANENPRPSSTSSVTKHPITEKNAKKQKENYDEAELNENSFQEEPAIKTKPVNLYDEIPIKSLTLPFEKFLEQEIKKTELNEELNISSPKHTFLKRKSQKILPKKETTPNISSPKSQFSNFLNEDTNNSSKLNQNPKQNLKEDSKNLESKTDESQSLNNPQKPKHLNPETTQNDLNPHSQDHNLPTSLSFKSLNSQKPRQDFLKRGEGKLCTRKRASSLARLEHKKSKLGESQKVDEDSREESSEYEAKEIIPEVKNKNYLKYKKLAKELEEKKFKLEKDATEFYKMRENEVKTLESWKNEEIRRINEEKKRAEKSFKVHDVFELENLKREIKQLKSSLLKNEEKYNGTVESLKEIIETLTKRNHELQKILQEKTFDGLECERTGKSASQVSVKMKPVRASLRHTKQETPKFKKSETSKVPPTFTFKLPDKTHIGKSSAPSAPSAPSVPSIRSTDSPPLIEISLEDTTPEKIQQIIEDNKTQKICKDGKQEIIFSNGVKKEIFPDGFIIVHFNNNDRKETFPDGKIVYHFFENQTVQTTFPDGLQLYEFSNGQTEKHFSDGTVEIKFPDGTVKSVFTNGDEESLFPDGTVQKVNKLGVKVVEFVNGMKDTILADGSKIRVYPDGKVRKTAPDGKVVE